MITFDDIYEALQDELTQDWVIGRTVNRSCITLKNKHISDEIQKRTRSNIKVQFWSSDIKNLKFEVASDKQYKDLRERLATSFREYIYTKNYPNWLCKSKGSTVANINLSDKEDATAKALVKEFCKFISDNIYKWALEILPELLPHEITNGDHTPNDQPKDDSYLPSKEDIELAESQLRKYADEIIGIETVLDQVEINFKKARKPLKENWRETTKLNIYIWFSSNSVRN